MSALPLRLALVAIAAAIPVAVAACAGADGSGTASADESMLTAADDARFNALLLEAFGSSTATSFQTTTIDHACVTTDPAASTYDWNAIAGQWMAPTLRAYLGAKKISEQISVVEVPAGDGQLDVRFYGNSRELDGAPSDLCAKDADGGAAMGNKVLLLTCKNIVSVGRSAPIAPEQCQ